MKTTGVPVTRRAIVQRINRCLAKDGELLKSSRGARAIQDLGEYFVIDISRNLVLAKQFDLEKKARELGVLKEFERLVDA